VRARRALTDLRAPDEAGAQERGWTVVRTAYRERPAPAAGRWSRWRPVSIAVAAVLIGALALSPAGATVKRLINRALDVPRATPAPLALPAPGTVLASGAGGTWTVARSGAARRLGAWQQASWSPHGRYIATATGDELATVTPDGAVAWRLTRPQVRDPRWYPPSGFRIAYLSRRQLRVVAGDGSADRLLATSVADIAPAWRPAHPYQLAYVTRAGDLEVRDAATGMTVWSAAPRAGRTLALSWSPTGTRLLLLGSGEARLYAADGRLVASIRLAPGSRASEGAVSPDGRTLALLRNGPAAEVQLVDLGSARPAARTVLSGAGLRQLVWSPDSRWLLVTWPVADQWLFVRVSGRPRILAASRVGERFAGRGAPRALPAIDGWCCTLAANGG
jgi:hypothetical protein